MLCFRYILVGPTPNEVHYLTNICTDAASYRLDANDEYYIVSFVDMEDARDVLQSYIDRMGPSPSQERLHADLVELLVGFITQDVMLDLVDLIPGFLRATYSWVWTELEYTVEHAKLLSDNGDLAKCATHALEFTG
jgi:hypothetical protein